MTETKCGKCREYICDCTCPDVTGYSQKRRLLREHRKTMRVMQGIIREYGLHGQYSEALQADTAQDWWPRPDYEELDESSDVEDPEKKARDDLEEYKREVANRKLFSKSQLWMWHANPSRTNRSISILRGLRWSGRTFADKSSVPNRK